MIENGNVAKKVAELIKEAINYNEINTQSPISVIQIDIQKGLMKHLKKDIADLKTKIDHYSYFSNFTIETQDNVLLVKLPFEGQKTISDDELLELAASGKTNIITNVLGEYDSDEEKEIVDNLRDRWQQIIDDMFSLKQVIEEEIESVESDRANNELKDLLSEISYLLDPDL